MSEKQCWRFAYQHLTMAKHWWWFQRQYHFHNKVSNTYATLAVSGTPEMLEKFNNQVSFQMDNSIYETID